MLQDLGLLYDQAKNNFRNNYINRDVKLTENFKNAYGAYMRNRNNSIDFLETTTKIVTNGSLDIYVPNQWFVIASYGIEFLRELLQYRKHTEAIFNSEGNFFAHADGSVPKRKELYEKFRNLNNEPDADVLRDQFRRAANAYLTTQNVPRDTIDTDTELLLRFLNDGAWWHSGKGIDRLDFYVSPLLSLFNIVQVTQSYVADIALHLANEASLYNLSAEISEADTPNVNAQEADPVEGIDLANVPRRDGGRNLIIYGAPGTGKSRKLQDEFGGEPLTKRVVFHPEYSYFDFIGSYKPVPLYRDLPDGCVLHNGDGTETNIGEPLIDYQFIPGPFIDVLVDAWLDPANMHTLLIEEINRANAAAVFGEIFQLLDRDATGKSEYVFHPSNELYNYLVSKGLRSVISEGVRIPSNMNIVATMNSADQGVNYIDSAFKRRWNFRYLRIDIDEAVHKDELIHYAHTDIKYGNFITAINTKLRALNVNEDRLIGPYFIRPTEVRSKDAIDKLLLYLWDDVLRHRRTQDNVFDSSVVGFTDLVDKFESKDVLKILQYITVEEVDNISEDAGSEEDIEESVSDSEADEE